MNQKSTPERNQEVKRMSDIYKYALNVVVWVGHAAYGSDEVIDFINGFSEARTKGIQEVRHCIRNTLREQGSILWDKMSEFIHRPYFFRLWIIQEIVLDGGRDTLLICGDKGTTMEKLHRLYYSFQFPENESRPTTDKELATAVDSELKSADPAVYEAYRIVDFWKWEKCEDLRLLQNEQIQGPQAISRNLMCRCRVALCADPVDKVYGILSLLSRNMSAKIIPDYNHNVQKVLMDFTRAWIESEGTLMALTEAGTSGENYTRDKTMPSWVIDLRQEIKQNVHRKYSVDGKKSAEVSFIRNGRVLSAMGVLFDRIDGTSGLRHRIQDCKNGPDTMRIPMLKSLAEFSGVPLPAARIGLQMLFPIRIYVSLIQPSWTLATRQGTQSSMACRHSIGTGIRGYDAMRILLFTRESR